MKAIKYVFILAASAFIFNSCTKNVAGPTGPTGPTGPQGATSSYNVIYDSVYPSPGPAGKNVWAVAPPPYSGFTFTMKNNAVTDPNGGLIEVYFSTSLNALSADWFQLPVASSMTTGDIMECDYELYQVQVIYINGSQPTGKLYFKVVIISNP